MLMKKTGIFAFVILLVISVFTLNFCYLGWQTIEIDKLGTFKIPGNWVYTRNEHIVYFSDRPLEDDGCKIYLGGSINYDTFSERVKMMFEDYDITFENFETMMENFDTMMEKYDNMFENDDYIPPHEAFDAEAEYVEEIVEGKGGEGFSNSASYYWRFYLVNGKKEEKAYLSLDGNLSLSMIDWYGNTEENVIIRIAKSYSME